MLSADNALTVIMIYLRNGGDDSEVRGLAGGHDLLNQREQGHPEGPSPHQEQPRHHAGLRDVRQQGEGGAGDTAR